MSRSIFVAFVVLCVVVCSKASKCQDAVVANLGVSAEEGKSMCSACVAVLPSSQCTSCFRAAKTLLAAAQCPSNPHVTTRRLLQESPPPSPSRFNGHVGDIQADGVTILIGKK